MVVLEWSINVDGHGLVSSAVSSAHACRVVGQLTTTAMVAVLLVVSGCGPPSCSWVVATCCCC